MRFVDCYGTQFLRIHRVRQHWPPSFALKPYFGWSINRIFALSELTLAAFSPSSFKWDTWSSTRLINVDTTMTMWPGSSEVRSNTSGSAWYNRDFPKPVGRLINTSFPSSTISLIPVSWCAFKLEIRNVWLTTLNASSRVAILQHETRNMIG